LGKDEIDQVWSTQGVLDMQRLECNFEISTGEPGAAQIQARSNSARARFQL
jgi:hypothetical protein